MNEYFIASDAGDWLVIESNKKYKSCVVMYHCGTRETAESIMRDLIDEQAMREKMARNV
jgi:hypothetical protein